MSCVSVPCKTSGTGPTPVPALTLPAIQGWMRQMYGVVPGPNGPAMNVSPGSIFPLVNEVPTGTGPIPAPNPAAPRAVTVWVVAGSLLVQVTVSPTLMIICTGVNHGWSLTMFTGWSTTAHEAGAPHTISAT